MNRNGQRKISATYIDGKSRIILLHSNGHQIVFNNEYPYDCMQQVKVTNHWER